VRLEIPGANMRRSNPDLDKYKELYGESIAATPKGANPGLQKSVEIERVENEGRRLRDSALKLNIPSSTRIAELFAIANGNQSEIVMATAQRAQAEAGRPLMGACEPEVRRAERVQAEAERVQAVNEFLGEFRSQREQFANGEIDGIDPLLIQGIRDWGLRIFAEPDPSLALKTLLGLRRPRGKRTKNSERDFEMVVAVLETRERMTLEEKKRVSLERAAEAVAQEYKLECEYVLKLYKQNRLAARAQIALRADCS
jgi:hypothetical protein